MIGLEGGETSTYVGQKVAKSIPVLDRCSNLQMPKRRRETREAEYRHWDCGITDFNIAPYIARYITPYITPYIASHSIPCNSYVAGWIQDLDICAKANFCDLNLPSFSIVTPGSIYTITSVPPDET